MVHLRPQNADFCLQSNGRFRAWVSSNIQIFRRHVEGCRKWSWEMGLWAYSQKPAFFQEMPINPSNKMTRRHREILYYGRRRHRSSRHPILLEKHGSPARLRPWWCASSRLGLVEQNRQGARAPWHSPRSVRRTSQPLGEYLRQHASVRNGSVINEPHTLHREHYWHIPQDKPPT